ncbi:MAG: DUF1361 domain-containing protein [Acidimicrobiales bacterium]|nr:DUF1361 domain-containing protein [Actinomycetota bacterium]
MAHLHQLLQEVALTVRPHRAWMTWNLLLAFVPAVLAVLLFAPPHRRRLGWWLGVAAFVVTLPNAPYVVTDLVHLRHSVTIASSDGVVLGVVLPLYAGFVLAGFLAYLLCTELVLREVRTVRPHARRWVVEGVLHVTSTVGILIGRIARLNSWDTVTDPANTLEQTFQTLTWRWAPVAFVLVLAAVWTTHLVVRTLVEASAAAGRSTWRAVTSGP